MKRVENKDYYQTRLKKLEQLSEYMIPEIQFWNITDNSFNFDKNEILKNPKSWFLVSCYIHSP